MRRNFDIRNNFFTSRGSFLSNTSREFLATLTSGGFKYLDNQPGNEEDKHYES